MVTKGGGVGRAFMASQKGKLRYATDIVTRDDLNTLTTQATELAQAIIAILSTIAPQAGSQVKPPLPSPKTLLPPKKLEKTLLYPLNAELTTALKQ
jgi:hypothetical protein